MNNEQVKRKYMLTSLQSTYKQYRICKQILKNIFTLPLHLENNYKLTFDNI